MDETNQVSAPTPSPQGGNRFATFFYANKVYIAVSLGIILIAAVSAWYVKTNQHSPPSQVGSSPRILSVWSATPQGNISLDKAHIAISFTLPVIEHHAQAFIDISPPVPGIWRQGATPFEIVFVPENGFYRGQAYEVHLRAGFPSDAGVKLGSDYIFSFIVQPEGKMMNFSSDNFAGKFMSFDQAQGANLNVEVGSEVRDPKVRIYRVATVEPLLKSLTFGHEQVYNGYAQWGSYPENQVATSGMQLVREVGSPRDQSRLEIRDEVGLYLLQGLDGNDVLQNTWLTLNHKGIFFRQDDQRVYLAAQDLATLEPATGISMDWYTLDDSPVRVKSTTLSGIGSYLWPFGQRLDLLVGRIGAEILIIPVGVPSSQAEIAVYRNLDESYQLFLHTDRPIYRPGDVVKYRGLVRRDLDGLYKLPSPSTKVAIEFDKYVQSGGINQTIDVGAHGEFSGEFTLSQAAGEGQSGTRYLYASVSGITQDGSADGSTYAYFDVVQYIKPEYGLEVVSDKDDVYKGESVGATIAGKYFDGRPWSNGQVKYQVFRRDFYETERAVYNQSFNLNSWGGMCGGGVGEWEEYYGESLGDEQAATLNAQGQATVHVETRDLPSTASSELTIVAKSTDSAGNVLVSAKRVIVRAGEFNIFIRPGRNQLTSAQPFSFAFYAERRDGTPVAGDFEYSLREYSWKDGKTNWQTVKKGNTKTDSKGVGLVTDQYSESTGKSLTLFITGHDSRGNIIEAFQYVYFGDAQSRYSSTPLLNIISKVANLTPGKKAELSIESPADLVVWFTFERGRVYKADWLKLKQGSSTVSFDVPDTYMPSITPTFSFFYQGKYHIEGVPLNVPAMKKLVTVTILTDKDRYQPGETALVTLTTKDATGTPLPAVLGVTVVDKAIFALRKNVTPPLHSSFYFFRGRSTNAASSLSWIANYDDGGRGGGGGDGGGEALNEQVDTLYWNPELTTGPDGTVMIAIPVGENLTMWRISTFASTDDSKFGQQEQDFQVAR